MLTFQLTVPVTDKTPIEELAAKKLGLRRVDSCVILKKSVDARKKNSVCYLYRVGVTVPNEQRYAGKDVSYEQFNIRTLENMTRGKSVSCRPVVVGSGPAGLFAALSLAYLGAKPVVLERGEDADARKQKIDRFNKTLCLDPESNVQFGEGGAGTFSDGKLNTGTHSEFIEVVLREFVSMGAPEEILYLSKPHIGTDILINVVKNIRKRIIELGGEFHFNTKLTDIGIEGGKVTSAITNKGVFPCDELYLAIGHSARDTFEMLNRKNVFMTSKTFSMGVRIEHLREKINAMQYGESARYLPSADYKCAVSVSPEVSLYTFCMCPGGKVINSSSEEGGICVNGMSLHDRMDDNSNSALLINVSEKDWNSSHPLAGMYFQRKYERKTYLVSGSFRPVVQTVGDFMKGKTGTTPTEVKPSVETGYALADLNECLPSSVSTGIREGLPLMGRKMRGFDDEKAVLCGIEGRSSSPVRIVRDENGQASVEGLFPIGEGAGYAGGIMSAAVDGLKSVLVRKKLLD